MKEPTDAQKQIFVEVLRECQRREAKWGKSEYSDMVWSLFLGEEYGEVLSALLVLRLEFEGSGFEEFNSFQFETELIQLLAVGFQWLEARRS